MGSDLERRIRHVTAVLGPTNTGKTHLAIERMVGHQSGMIGLPLRLLAREVYDKLVKRVGVGDVALITGEEKIKPERARYWVSTVEAMPRDIEVDFLAIDEVQLAADPERGHVFTDRLLNARGQSETLLLGSQTMRSAISDLIPGANFISRPRLSKLSYAGEKKLTRLPTRSAVVAFSANEVYATAELIRRQRGGTAVVLGALSPRTRNAQVALYQSGDVDFLVATDAVGMGLNLDVDHVAFSAVRKFDGQAHRELTLSEIGQIAGRAGRHLNDGTFGVTGRAEAFDAETIENLETHNFPDVNVLQWRNRKLDFSSLEHLRESLKQLPTEARLVRARTSDDVEALEIACRDGEVTHKAVAPAAVAKLWDVCQIPDYRKISSQVHGDLVAKLYKFLMSPEERIPEDWFAEQVAFADRTDGDIDTLATRLAHIRTWTFVANRSDWLSDPVHWQGRTRAIEDTLSDAMHERLTQRFVDKRTSALMRGMRNKEDLTAEISDTGEIRVENHFVGRIEGFCYTPDAQGEGIHGKAARNAAAQVLNGEISMRCRRVAAAKTKDILLRRDGKIVWRDEVIGRAEAGDDVLNPIVRVLADEHMSGPDREKVQNALEKWILALIKERLAPLVEISSADEISGLARGIAFQLKENLGVLKRDDVADDVKALDQTARGQLRKYGVRFGAFNIYFPILLKPAAAELAATLWALKNSRENASNLADLPELPRAGLTSSKAPENVIEAYYRAYGFHICGPRAVRLDILERLADLIRPLLAWRRDKAKVGESPPEGATGEGAFKTTPGMMSILGCSPEELSIVLKALGFRLERRPVQSVNSTEDKALPSQSDGNAKTDDTSDESGMAQKDESSSPSEEETDSARVKIDAVTDKTLESDEVSGDGVAKTELAAGSTDPADGETQATAEAGVGGSSQTVNSEPKPALPGQEADEAGSDDGVSEKLYEEIWRPRRRPRGRQMRRGKGSDHHASQQKTNQRNTEARVGESEAPGRGEENAEAGSNKKTRRNRSGAGEKWGRNKTGAKSSGPQRRSKHKRGDDGQGKARGPRVHQSGPKKKDRGGKPDPDSPFAALSSLKDLLDKDKNNKTEEKSS